MRPSAPSRAEHAERLLAPAAMVEVRLDVAHARGLLEDADRPLALHVERLALDLVEHAVDEQRASAERAVHRREHPVRELAEGAQACSGSTDAGRSASSMNFASAVWPPRRSNSTVSSASQERSRYRQLT